MRNVDDVSGRIDRNDRSLHRANKIILRAEVGKESDDGLPISDCQFSISTPPIASVMFRAAELLASVSFAQIGNWKSAIGI